MATKHTDTCLRKAADEEPIFVLRAQDRLAPAVVERWAELAEQNGVPASKTADAWETAALMRQWHTRKLPD